MSNNRRHFHKKPHNKPADNYIPPYDAMLLAEPVDSLKIHPNLLEKLKTGKVETLNDVAKRRANDFYKINKFNKRDFFDLKRAVEAKGVAFRPSEEKPVDSGHLSAENKEERGKREENLDKRENAKEKRDGRNLNVAKTPNLNNRQSGREERRDNFKNNANNQQVRAGEERKDGFSRDLRDGSRDKDRNSFSNRERGNRDNKDRRDNRDTRTNNQPPTANHQTNIASHSNWRITGSPNRPQATASQQTPTHQDRYLKISKNGKWGFMERGGKEIIAAVYDEVFSFKEDLCCVEKDERFGFINRLGEVIVPIIYDCALSFSEGYACVYKSDKCGYINKENEVVVDFKFEAGTPVTDGGCRVKQFGKWGEMNINSPDNIRWI